MTIAKYPIVQAQKTLNNTTIQKKKELESGVIKTSLKKSKHIKKLVILLTMKSKGTSNLRP